MLMAADSWCLACVSLNAAVLIARRLTDPRSMNGVGMAREGCDTLP
jgi:hypothetical protein